MTPIETIIATGGMTSGPPQPVPVRYTELLVRLGGAAGACRLERAPRHLGSDTAFMLRRLGRMG